MRKAALPVMLAAAICAVVALSSSANGRATTNIKVAAWAGKLEGLKARETAGGGYVVTGKVEPKFKRSLIEPGSKVIKEGKGYCTKKRKVIVDLGGNLLGAKTNNKGKFKAKTGPTGLADNRVEATAQEKRKSSKRKLIYCAAVKGRARIR